MEMTYVKYVCAACGAEDTDRFFPGEAHAPAVDCYKCHSGQSKTLAEMFQRRLGMFPALEEAAHA